MPANDKPEALQVPRTLMDRLAADVGNRVVVYLMHVHAESIIGGPGPCPPYPPAPPPQAPVPGGGAWGGPPLTPGVPPGGGHLGPIPLVPLAWECEPGKYPEPMMETAMVSGTLAFVGPDFIVIRVPDCMTCKDIIIPYNAIGLILSGTM